MALFKTIKNFTGVDFGLEQSLYGEIDRAFVNLLDPMATKSSSFEYIEDYFQIARGIIEGKEWQKMQILENIGPNYADYPDDVVRLALKFSIDVEDAAALFDEKHKFDILRKQMPEDEAVNALSMASKRAKKKVQALFCLQKYIENLKENSIPGMSINYEPYVGGLRFIHKDKEKEISTICVEPFSDSVYLSCFSVVNKDDRHKGYGTIMMSEMKKMFGDRAIVLDVERDNTPAVKFYEKHGFKRMPGVRKNARIQRLYFGKLPTQETHY